MIDLNKFNRLQKSSKDSFFQQKKLLKQVMSGQKVLCQSCQQALTFKANEDDRIAMITCKKGCTDIQLSF